MPTTRFVNVAGKKTQLTEGGSGPPLLYLHSAGGETEWMPFHEELAKSFTVLLPAHPGFADSKGLEEIRDVTDYAWHYVDLLSELKLKSVPVVGFSLGGWTGMELALLRPNLVSKLVLVNSAGIRLPDAKMGELFIDDLDQLKKLLFLDPNNPVIKLAMPSELEDPRILHWLRAREATARVGWNPYLHNPRLPAHLRRLECPTLVLWGRHDQLIPLAHGEYLAQAIPGAKLEVFDNSAHMLPFEQPVEFAERVKAFVL
ncbi:alpha/beta fold hydrolase [Anatilimnocola sp. NA78]|uniref:alpha/beta fold hydrolase n=1 Tax=Anatilimnocola sp. NA78 TaxID=3415683 RepID=UPI003CE4F59C